MQSVARQRASKQGERGCGGGGGGWGGSLAKMCSSPEVKYTPQGQNYRKGIHEDWKKSIYFSIPIHLSNR